MEQQLRGQVALVTGGARRLGRAIALGLAGEGADVVIHYRGSAAEAERVADEVRGRGVRAHTLQADLAVWREAEQLVPRAVAVAGGVDILVNNASVFPPGTLGELSPEALAETLQINAFAPLVLARALAAGGRAARVVNLLDTRVALPGDPEHLAYQLSKRTLLDVTRLLALELAPRVLCNGVAPGAVLAPPGAPADHLEAVAATTPLGRAGRVEDVVEAVCFLARSRYTTGDVIFVDGGQHLKGRADV